VRYTFRSLFLEKSRAALDDLGYLALDDLGYLALDDLGYLIIVDKLVYI